MQPRTAAAVGSRRCPGMPTRLVISVLACFLLGGCASWDERLENFREHWTRGDLQAAGVEIDTLIENESGVDAEILSAATGREEDVRVDAGDTWLLLLEKAMVELATDRLDPAIEWMRRVRDHMDSLFEVDAMDGMREVAAILRDDTVRRYRGADYEHILVRCFLALASLLDQDGDTYAYALQIGEIQERIIGSDFGADAGYEPREAYERLAFGAWLQGLLHESRLETQEALRHYRRALDYESWPVIRESIERLEEGLADEREHGVLHVFYLAGQGPHLAESVHPPTELALRLASVGLAIGLDSPSALVQAPVLVPEVVVTDPHIPPLVVEVEGGESTETQPILSVNRIARQQFDAMLPWTLARAVVRRTLKTAAAVAVEKSIEHAADDHHAERSGRRSHRGRGRGRDYSWRDRARDDAAAVGIRFLAFLAGSLTNFILTVTESADTRCWSTLPAEIHVARLPLEPGLRRVHLGPELSVDVRIDTGYDSFIVVIRPRGDRPGVALVDRASRPRG